MKRNDPDRSTAAFTLAELLIVVAIIAVLVAIAIPIFTSQLEKSREAADLANVRAAYAEVMTAAISEDAGASYGGQKIKKSNGTYSAVVTPLIQQKYGWTTNADNLTIGGVRNGDSNWIGEPAANGSCTVTYDPSTDTTTIDWAGGTSGGSGGTGGNTGNAPTPKQYQEIGVKLFALLGDNNNTRIEIDVDENGKLNVKDDKHSPSQDQVYAALKNQNGIEERSDGLYINNTGDNKVTMISLHNNNGNNKKIVITYGDKSSDEIPIAQQ